MKVFIGWDSREDIAYQVAKHSIEKNTPGVEVIPLKLNELREQGVYWRSEDKMGSTEFTISRFLVPYLSDFKGYSMFIDCDMLALGNLRTIDQYITNDETAVWCVQHDYSPKSMTKMDGKKQHIYPRKNWSSMMYFNNEECGALVPEVVNTETPMYLHRMLWADDKIGSLPHSFNFLAGYYEWGEPYDPLLIHYTDGGPWFKEHHDCPLNHWWKREVKEMFGIK